MIGLSTKLEPPWTWLDHASSVGGTLRVALDAARAGTGGLQDPAFIEAWKQGLAEIAGFSSRRLDALAREALDLCSHRLDAWLTAVAAARLASMRAPAPGATAPTPGIHVGAYGVVEGLVRAPAKQEVPPPAGEDGPLFAAKAPGGFIHAPSMAHATTAALLRSGFVSRRGDAGTPFAVDLRSARMRPATKILEAVRAGDSLGQVLGRRVERALLDAKTPPLWTYLFPLRRVAAPGKPNPDRIPADGYALAKRARAGSLPWGGAEGLPPPGSSEAGAIQAVVADLEDALDAVGDLLVAESVHQLAQGNPARASGALDALAQGAPPPAELGVLDLPSSGIGLSHRILAMVPADARATGWATTPRTQGEPALEAWCASLLGPASGYQVRVRYLAADGTEVGAETLSLDACGIGALDAVRASSTSELSARVLDVARELAPSGTGGAAQIVIDPARVGGSRTLDDAILLGGALGDVLARARAAEALDLAPRSDANAGHFPVEEATLADLEARGSDSALADALAALASDPHAGLLAAASLGVAGAVPSTDPTRWPAQVAAATRALTARQERLAGLAPASTPDQRLARALDRLHILLGDDAPLAPRFTPPASELGASLADQAALVGPDPTEPATWLAHAAAARAEVAPFERVLFLADTLAPGDPALDLRIAQLPFTAGEPWIGRAVFAGDAPPQRSGRRPSYRQLERDRSVADPDDRGDLPARAADRRAAAGDRARGAAGPLAADVERWRPRGGRARSARPRQASPRRR